MSDAGPQPPAGLADVLARFDWDDVDVALGWHGAARVDLGLAIVDRHRSSSKAALLYLDEDGRTSTLTFAQLAERSDRAARLLRELGVRPGDRVAGLMPRSVEVMVAILGALKAGAVYVPIFTGFRDDAVLYRLEHSEARVVFTHASVRAHMPDKPPAHVICVREHGRPWRDSDVDFVRALDTQPAQPVEATLRGRDETAAIIYTSGSTGRPKGGAIAANFLAACWPYLVHGAAIGPDDVFWPTGDPGWGYGFVCHLGALAMGCTVFSTRGNPSAETCLAALRDRGITKLATTPTLLRSIMALGATAATESRPPLQAISSCGEPLNAEVVNFFRRTWGITPMDHFGATELGLPIGNFNSIDMKPRPGSMGWPFPGHVAAVIDNAGCALPAGQVGRLAVLADRRSMYWTHYWRDPAATRAIRCGPWIATGDLARRDGDGYFWFEGRDSDLIKSAGYRIGPFEVESALLGHAAVAEAAVVGKPDALRGELVKAYVVLKAGYRPGAEMADELREFVRLRQGAHLTPREIDFEASLPKTETGKIQRFLLRDRARAEATRKP